MQSLNGRLDIPVRLSDDHRELTEIIAVRCDLLKRLYQRGDEQGYWEVESQLDDDLEMQDELGDLICESSNLIVDLLAITLLPDCPQMAALYFDFAVGIQRALIENSGKTLYELESVAAIINSRERIERNFVV